MSLTIGDLTIETDNADAVIDFWFGELSPDQWYVSSASLDAAIGARFGQLHRAASRCELFAWRNTAALGRSGATEADHEFVWLEADTAWNRLAHGSQAWAARRAMTDLA